MSPRATESVGSMHICRSNTNIVRILIGKLKDKQITKKRFIYCLADLQISSCFSTKSSVKVFSTWLSRLYEKMQDNFTCFLILREDDCVHMLHSILSQTVPGPVLNAHGLSVQMVHCNLLCSLDATLSSRAAWGHRFQLRAPSPLCRLLAPGN